MYIVENIHVTPRKRSRQISSDWKCEEQNNMPRLQESREAIFAMKAITSTRSLMKDIEVVNGTFHGLAQHYGLWDLVHKYCNTVTSSTSQSNWTDEASELDNLQTKRTKRNAEGRELELPVGILEETTHHFATLRVDMLHTFKQRTLMKWCVVNRRPTVMHKW